jgi:quinol monooxygenase YgiN
MIYKIAEFTVKTDKLSEAQQIIQEFLKAIKEHDAGVERYESFQDHGGNRFFHLMTFADRKAESGHQQASYTLTFLKKLYPLCEKEPVFSSVELLKAV